MNKQEKIEWYNNPSIISWVLIVIFSLTILTSQSFSADGSIDALKLVQNILNHNITYMIMIVYFVLLHTKFGKKYFDYSNVLMIIFFLISFVTSILSLLQSFSLIALLNVFNNFLLFIYFSHTFLRGTRFWKDFNLSKSLFNELGNDWYFDAIVVIEVTLFAVSLISMTTVDGTFFATLDCICSILFARYIYLYGEYLDSIKKNPTAPGNFDHFCDRVDDIATDAITATTDFIDNALIPIKDEKEEEIKNSKEKEKKVEKDSKKNESEKKGEK